MIRKTYNNNQEVYNLEDDRQIEGLYLKINFFNPKFYVYTSIYIV